MINCTSLIAWIKNIVIFSSHGKKFPLKLINQLFNQNRNEEINEYFILMSVVLYIYMNDQCRDYMRESFLFEKKMNYSYFFFM